MNSTPQEVESKRPAPGGRARDPELDDTIASATRALLEERGFPGLTIEAIARRAGVGRATIYRRWPNRDALLLHLFRGLVREVPIPDHGDVRDDLIELLGDQLKLLEDEAGKLHPSLGVQAGIDPAAGDALWDLIQRRNAALSAVLRRGIERQQIRSDCDIDLSFYLIWGPVYYRYLGARVSKKPIGRDFIPKLVDTVLASIGTTDTDGTRIA